MNVGSVEPATVVATLRQALAAVEKLSSERAGLEEALKVERNKDNLLPKLMANASQSPDALFKEEIKKYEPLKVRPVGCLCPLLLHHDGVCESVSRYFDNFDSFGTLW